MESPDTNALIAAATVLYQAEPNLLREIVSVVTDDGFSLFVFINGRESEAVEALLASAPGVSIIRSDVNVGLGVGLNAVIEAAAEAGCSHVFLLDQDSTPAAGLIGALYARSMAATRQGRRIAAVGPKLIAPVRSSFIPISYLGRPSESLEGAVAFLPTSGSLISIAAWREIGPMRADYFIDGIDVEWGYRAWHSGWASVLAEDLSMVHRWGVEADGPRSKRDAGSDRRLTLFRHRQAVRLSAARTYFYMRNAACGLRLKHMPLQWKSRQLLRMTVQAVLIFATRRKEVPLRLMGRAVADGWHGRLGPLPADLNVKAPT